MARPKAHPAGPIAHSRIRHDTVDQFGKLTLRTAADRNYWRNQQKSPGRRPGRSASDDSTHV
ncbi:hypothetical protein MHOL44478_15450 [Mycobacterium holsaticum DSM 44478]|nr:hypothetical protein [Mycolicibacterium holsaticum DSM 44478 = JCM 12374]